MTTTLSAIAEFENNRPKELQKKGIQAAQRKGKYQGPKTVINKTLIQKVKHLKETKNLSVSEIRKLSYHLQSLKRAFRLRIKSINQTEKRISKINLGTVEFARKSTQSTLPSILVRRGFRGLE